MRQRLAPMLFDDPDKKAADAGATIKRSDRQADHRLTADGLPVHSFHTPLADLATLVRNTIVTAIIRSIR